ncbi:AraC family transcriptional regulator [Chitinophaga silvisoli]|uniref:AraC family transcriptional regulator n=1 Tax=Chitinophaga silvisoli TaxID=2291814 RepID=A0A3E1P1P3_9BACT|nr:AraC family transcriptional regulator [Chitinophaga silvisoli]RFM34099.1 AraC family transcriptional regulator [Chitinophaga silvisoli]
MALSFDKVYQDVQRFRLGAYCSTSEKGEIATPFHTHNKGQFIYAEKGTLHIATADRQYFLPVEHFIWIPRGVTHRMWTNNATVRMFTIYFDNQHLEDDFYQTTGVYMVNNLLHEMIRFVLSWEGHIGKSEFSSYQFLQALKAILPGVSKTRQLPLLGFIKPRDERLQEVIDYMRKHLDEKLELGQVAGKFGFSTRSLSRSFNAEGTSFIEYLQSLRIIQSMELLAEKDFSISRIAAMVGYDSITAFSHTFMRFTGIRPSAYTKGLLS